MKSRILLTGATGFVGSQILKSLQNEDVDIIIIVREGFQKKIINKNRITKFILTNDLFSESIDWWIEVCNKIDIIIHAAWFTEPGKYLMSDKNLDCMQGTLNMARGASISRVKKFVGIGSCFEYDLSKGILSIDTPLKPLSPYSASKVATYLFLSELFIHKEIEFSWCRLFYLFGEGEDSRRLAPYIKSRLKENKVVKLTSGDQIRDFMNVLEAGRLISNVALGNTKGAVNICSGIPTTIREFSENIANKYGQKDLLQFGARPNDEFNPATVIGVPTKIT